MGDHRDDADDDGDLFVNRYTNDGTGPPSGRSHGPRGQGPWESDASVEVPFHYRVVTVRGDDGVRMRFPTHREQPGGGRGYFAFGAYAVLRQRFLHVPVGCAWSVDVPRRAELGARGFYHENRFVFSVGRENVSNTVGVRFVDERRLGVFVGTSATPIDELDLAIDARGSRLHLAAALGSSTHPGRIVFDANEGGLVFDVDPALLRPPAANAIVLCSAGNGVAQPAADEAWRPQSDDDDEALFFALSDIAAVTP